METENTIFHKIIRREIPADIVYEDELCLAFRDVAPVSPTHILIIPKKSISKLSQAVNEDKELLGHMLLTATAIAKEQGISKDGFRLVINNGERACQSVFLLHMHILGGREFSWPPG